jgi:hypothetical protein
MGDELEEHTKAEDPYGSFEPVLGPCLFTVPTAIPERQVEKECVGVAAQQEMSSVADGVLLELQASTLAQLRTLVSIGGQCPLSPKRHL